MVSIQCNEAFQLLKSDKVDDCLDQSCIDCISQLFGHVMWEAADKGTIGTLAGQAVSMDQAASKALRLSRAIRSNQMHIRRQLEQYGDVVLTRWRKKSKHQKQALILEARPDIFPSNCAPQHLLLHPAEARPALLDQPQYRGALLLPYLNLESLMHDPMRLPALLHFRSAFALGEWAAFDSAQHKWGFESAYLAPQFNQLGVILHGGDYGKMVLFDKEDAHDWTTVGYTRAVLVLEAQEILYGFLRRVTDLLTVDAQPSGCSAWRNLTSTGLSSPGEVEAWSPYINAPFSAPPKFNPDECLRKIRAILGAAEDHLSLLQTDPKYFQDVLAQWRRNEVLSKYAEESFWRYMQADVMVNVAGRVLKLQAIVDELKKIREIYDHCRDQIRCGSRLPQDFNDAMGELEWHCLYFYQLEREGLGQVLMESPGFVHYFHVTSQGHGGVGYRLKEISGHESTGVALFHEHRLFWAFQQLCKDPEDELAEQPSVYLSLIDEILATSSTKERARVDQRLYDHLSRMSCYYELVSAVRLHRPRPRRFLLRPLAADEKSRPVWKSHQIAQISLSAMKNKDLARLLKDFNDAQWPKGKHNHAWLEKANEARRRLAAFWARARDLRRRDISGLEWSTADVEEHITLFSADQTAEHGAEVQAEKDEVARFVAAEEAKVIELRLKSSAPVQTVWGEDENHSKLSLPLGNPKPKSRPTSSKDSVSLAPEKETVIPKDSSKKPELPKIYVNHESLRIFARMFPSSNTQAKGITKWAQFVTAMTDAGFPAVNSGGSTVHFGSDEGSIVFHKPHPEPNIDAVALQNMGRRMRKWFGWEWERFAERKKTN